jgi:LemA protein
MIAIAVVGGILLVVAIGVAVAYNRFVQQRQYIDNAWANVETELERRYALVPNLVETVKGYAAHERSTFEAVTTARALAVAEHGDAAAQAQTENALVDALQGLLAVSEAYPALEASANFLDLQRQLIATEDRIQAARRFYNNNVRSYNERVQSVPSNVIARLFGFSNRPYFDIEQAVRTGSPQVSFDGD